MLTSPHPSRVVPDTSHTGFFCKEKTKHYKPAELGADILEGGGQDASDVCHVEVKQGNPKKRIHHRGNLAQRRFRRQVSITFVDKCEIDMSTNICAGGRSPAQK